MQPTCTADAADGPGGVLAQARDRALMLARAGGTDAQIHAALRAEFCDCRPQRLAPSRLAKRLAAWIEDGDVDNARQAGELEVLEKLQQTALGEELAHATRAAIHLDSRRVRLLEVDQDVARLVRKLLAMPEAAVVAELEEALAALKGRQVKADG